jgi:hypothetical protein
MGRLNVRKLTRSIFMLQANHLSHFLRSQQAHRKTDSSLFDCARSTERKPLSSTRSSKQRMFRSTIRFRQTRHP